MILPSSAPKKLTAADRESIARQWRTSGLPQERFAEMHGIAPRTLRLWLKAYAPASPPVERLREIIDATQKALEVIRADLDAGVETTEENVVPVGIPSGAGFGREKPLPSHAKPSPPKFSWED